MRFNFDSPFPQQSRRGGENPARERTADILPLFDSDDLPEDLLKLSGRLIREADALENRYPVGYEQPAPAKRQNAPPLRRLAMTPRLARILGLRGVLAVAGAAALLIVAIAAPLAGIWPPRANVRDTSRADPNAPQPRGSVKAASRTAPEATASGVARQVAPNNGGARSLVVPSVINVSLPAIFSGLSGAEQEGVLDLLEKQSADAPSRVEI